MEINALLNLLASTPENVSFEDVITCIDENYTYTPTQFINGTKENQLINEAGTNEGSCKIFFFAMLHELNEAQTLACFGKYYRQDVLLNLGGKDHMNIRNFMRAGWDGIQFSGEALSPKN